MIVKTRLASTTKLSALTATHWIDAADDKWMMFLFTQKLGLTFHTKVFVLFFLSGKKYDYS